MNNKIIKILEPYITRLRLPTHTKLRPREFVIENPNPNQYRVHMRVWDGEKIPGKITKEEKQALFDAAYKEIPEGGEILFPESNPIDYIATRGTVAGLQRLARDSRFLPGNKGVLYYLDKDGLVKTFEGTSFIKKLNVIPKKQLGGKFLQHLINVYGRDTAIQMFKNIRHFYGTPNFNQKFLNKAKYHKDQMDFIKKVENLGGQLGGSAYLAKYGTVNRQGLLHDLDFTIPNVSIRNNIQKFSGNGSLSGWTTNGIVNIPYQNGNIYADMFIRDSLKDPLDRVLRVMEAKRMFARPKDLQDIQNFELYSRSNPLIKGDKVQWNPTLFSSGILDNNNFPIIELIETYPSSGIQVPVVMNDLGEIRRIL